MRGTIRLESLAPIAALAVAWTSHAAAQTAPATAPPAAPPPPAVAPSATAAFPTTAPPPAPPPRAPGVPAGATAPAVSGPAPEARRRAIVRFEADEPGALLESDTTADGRPVAWYVVCEAPCTRSVSTSGSYRVGGYGFHDSRAFRLPDDRAELSVQAEMESSSIAFPMALTIVGGVFASVGGMLALVGLSEEEQHRDGEDFIVSGAVVGGAGFLVASVGVVMLLVDAENDESRARVAKPSVELPGGLALEPRGVTF